MQVNSLVSINHGVAFRAPAMAAGAQSGKGSPQLGNAVPALARGTDLREAMQQIIVLIAANTRELNFRVDRATGRVVITVVNPSSGKVIRQIPSEVSLRLARELQRLGLDSRNIRLGDIKLIDARA